MIELSPYLVLLLVGFLPNEIWRVLGVWIGRSLPEDSEFVVWVRAVAVAVLAAVIAKLTLAPPGALATAAPLAVRLAAIACGFITFLIVRRSVFAGLVAGESALLIGGLLFPA
jgi:branched-subunit amino acid transport protein AzlD